MAVYVPAGSWERAAETCCIIKAEEKDGYIVITSNEYFKFLFF